MAGIDFTQVQFPPTSAPVATDQQSQVTIALPLPASNQQTKSVSAPLAGAAASASGSNSSLGSTTVSNSGSSASFSAPSLGTSSAGSSSTLASATSDDALKAAQFAAGAVASTTTTATTASAPSISSVFAQSQDQSLAQRYNISEESWKHHAQARAILSNLIGPNGEQLTSSDPYNTTVFVGGLSPLISEETLRTFFAPFGEIHYVSSRDRH